MSATAQTGNYHLPIYEPGNLANYMVDWNGAMNTIDSALNVNHQDADKLKTDFENLETEFQQVKTESSGAATASTQAQEDAARAITIANNATTVAGDAQVDAHAALEFVNEFTSPTIVMNITHNATTDPLYGYCHISGEATPIGFTLEGEVIVHSNNAEFGWPLIPGKTDARYCPTPFSTPNTYIQSHLNNHGIYGIGRVPLLQGAWESNTLTKINFNVAWWGIYQESPNKQYLAVQVNNNPTPVTPYWHFAVHFFIPYRPNLIVPPRLKNNDGKGFYTLKEFESINLNTLNPLNKIDIIDSI